MYGIFFFLLIGESFEFWPQCIFAVSIPTWEWTNTLTMSMTAPTWRIDNKEINMFNTFDLMLNLLSLPNSPRHQNVTQNTLFSPKYFNTFHLPIRLLGQNSLHQTLSKILETCRSWSPWFSLQLTQTKRKACHAVLW